ncbi:iron ABC transporter ATP-binding protein [Corynebacterium camporealensis]
MIKLRNVQKAYSSETHIGPINLQIPEGGITALVGPNGAGKSTMLTMIGRLLGMDDGQIEVAGYDITMTKSSDLAKIVSILRQENHFVTKLTVRQLVGFGRFPYTKGRINKHDEEIISKYIRFLHLEQLQDRYLDELSGGQRQRAYVAMVLCQETDYVLLDEPLNNLDIAHSVEMMKHLREAARELGRTVIVVLHDINFAARYADYVCACKDGQIVAFGPTKEIMQEHILTPIFNTPIKVIDGPDGLLACYH